MQSSSRAGTTRGLNVFTYSSGGEDIKLNLSPRINSVPRGLILVPVVLPQLRTKIEEVDHRAIAPLPLHTILVQFLLQHVFDELGYHLTHATGFDEVGAPLLTPTFDDVRTTSSSSLPRLS